MKTAIILTLLSIVAIQQFKRHDCEPTVVIKHSKRPHEITPVVGTVYNSVASQCDSDPLVTADGSKITSKPVRWVALSRDLLSRWGGEYDYGDTIWVYHPDVRLCGQWVVHDCMNARFSNRIDFMNPEFYGKFEGVLISKSSIL